MTLSASLFLWFHLVTALLSSVVCSTLYVRFRPRKWLPLWRNLLLFDLLLPFLGACLITPLWLLLHLFPRRPKRPARRRIYPVALEQVVPPSSPPKILLKPLLDCDLPEEEIIALMNSMTPLKAPEETRMLKKIAHNHPSPTVRMVAIQILSHERQDRQQWMARLEEGLRGISERGRAWLYGQIGWIGYRLAYLELVESEERERYLEQADSYLQLACMMEAYQGAFWFASAEVARLRGDRTAFEERLDWARKLGMPVGLLWLPTLELAKATGEWSRLEPLLKEALADWPILPWVQLWQKRERA